MNVDGYKQGGNVFLLFFSFYFLKKKNYSPIKHFLLKKNIGQKRDLQFNDVTKNFDDVYICMPPSTCREGK
jgi:hypothetical protein